ATPNRGRATGLLEHVATRHSAGEALEREGVVGPSASRAADSGDDAARNRPDRDLRPSPSGRKPNASQARRAGTRFDPRAGGPRKSQGGIETKKDKKNGRL